MIPVLVLAIAVELEIFFRTGSLSLQMDAFYILCQIISTVVALWAFYYLKARPRRDLTYGVVRAETLSSIISAALVMSIGIL